MGRESVIRDVAGSHIIVGFFQPLIWNKRLVAKASYQPCRDLLLKALCNNNNNNNGHVEALKRESCDIATSSPSTTTTNAVVCLKESPPNGHLLNRPKCKQRNAQGRENDLTCFTSADDFAMV
jgi:hypothetical protein